MHTGGHQEGLWVLKAVLSSGPRGFGGPQSSLSPAGCHPALFCVSPPLLSLPLSPPLFPGIAFGSWALRGGPPVSTSV